MKLLGSLFLGMGLLFALIGGSWFYVFITTSHSLEFSEAWIGPMVFTFVGLVFAAVGGGILYYQIKQQERRELLLRSGRKIRAVISNRYYNTNISLNNRHPLVIECVAELNGRRQDFKSHHVWNPTHYEIGQEVAVYVDTRNSANYWVEVGE